MLVAAVSLASLPPPHFRMAFRTAVPLATVATDTDCEYGPASRVTANPKPKNSVLVDVHIGHKEIVASRPGRTEVVGIRHRRVLALEADCAAPG